jgi:hypothetical protein
MPTLSIDIEAKLASFQDSLASVDRNVQGLAGRLEGAFGGLSKALTGIAGLAGLGAFAAMTRNVIDLGDELSKLSQKTGLAVE